MQLSSSPFARQLRATTNMHQRSFRTAADDWLRGFGIVAQLRFVVGQSCIKLYCHFEGFLTSKFEVTEIK